MGDLEHTIPWPDPTHYPNGSSIASHDLAQQSTNLSLVTMGCPIYIPKIAPSRGMISIHLYSTSLDPPDLSHPKQHHNLLGHFSTNYQSKTQIDRDEKCTAWKMTSNNKPLSLYQREREREMWPNNHLMLCISGSTVLTATGFVNSITSYSQQRSVVDSIAVLS